MFIINKYKNNIFQNNKKVLYKFGNVNSVMDCLPAYDCGVFKFRVCDFTAGSLKTNQPDVFYIPPFEWTRFDH